LASISKSIPEGYQEFDLDALMRNDKNEDCSKALQSITNTIQCNQRLKEKLLPYGTADVFQITLLDPSALIKVRKTVDLFTEFSKVDESKIIESCNTYCEMSNNKNVLNTYNQDLIWSQHTVEKSIVSSSLLHEVLVDMDLVKPQDRTGPMMLYKLMMKLIDHSSPARAAMKQA